MVAAGTCPGCCHECDHTEDCPALCGVCKNRIAAEQRQFEFTESERRADEAYQHSAYRQAQQAIMKWVQDERLDDDQSYTVRTLRSTTNLNRRTWFPSLDELFALADTLGITFSKLLGLTPELPPCTSEWHKYPVDKPNDGETVLCRYGHKGNFRVLIYQDGAFGERLNNEFVSMPFEVSYWTRAYPEV